MQLELVEQESWLGKFLDVLAHMRGPPTRLAGKWKPWDKFASVTTRSTSRMMPVLLSGLQASDEACTGMRWRAEWLCVVVLQLATARCCSRWCTGGQFTSGLRVTSCDCVVNRSFQGPLEAWERGLRCCTDKGPTPHAARREPFAQCGHVSDLERLSRSGGQCRLQLVYSRA